MFFLKLFVVATILLTALYYWATQGRPNPLPLWPDSLVIGGSVAVIVTAVAARLSMDRKAARHLRNSFRLLWIGRGRM